MSAEEIKYSTEVAGGGFLDPVTGSYYVTQVGAEQAQAQAKGLSNYWTVEGAGQVFKSKEEAEAYSAAHAPTVWTIEGVDQKFQSKEEAQAYIEAHQTSPPREMSTDEWLVTPAGQAYLHSDKRTQDIERFQQPYIEAYEANKSRQKPYWTLEGVDTEFKTKEEAQAYAEAHKKWTVDVAGKSITFDTYEQALKASQYQPMTVEPQIVEPQGSSVVGLPIPGPGVGPAPGSIGAAISERLTGGFQSVQDLLEVPSVKLAELGAGIGPASQKAWGDSDYLGAVLMGGASIGIGAGVAAYEAVTFPVRPKAWGETAAFAGALATNPMGTFGAIASDFWTNPLYKAGYWGANLAMLGHAGKNIYKGLKTRATAVEVKGLNLEKVGTKTGLDYGVIGKKGEAWDLSFRASDEGVPPLPEGMTTGYPDPLSKLIPDVEFGKQTYLYRVTSETKPFVGDIPKNAIVNPDTLVGILSETEGGVTLQKPAIFKGFDSGKLKAGKPFISDDIQFATFDTTAKAPSMITKVTGYGDLGEFKVVSEADVLGVGDLLEVKGGKPVITKPSGYRVDLEYSTKMVDVTGPKVVQPTKWDIRMVSDILDEKWGEPGLFQKKPAVIDWDAPTGKVEIPTVTSKIVKTSDLGVDIGADVTPLMGDAFKIEVKGFAQTPQPEPSLTPFKQIVNKTPWATTEAGWGPLKRGARLSQVGDILKNAKDLDVKVPTSPSVSVVGAPSGGPGGASMFAVTDVAVSPVIFTYPRPNIAPVGLLGLSAFKVSTPAPQILFPSKPSVDVYQPVLRLSEPSKQEIFNPPRISDLSKPIVKSPKIDPYLEPPRLRQDTIITPITIHKTSENLIPKYKVVDILKSRQPTEEKQIQLPAFKWSPPPTTARSAFGMLPPPGFSGGGFGGKSKYRKRLQRIPLPTMKDITRSFKA